MSLFSSICMGIIDALCRIAKLIKLSPSNIHRMWLSGVIRTLCRLVSWWIGNLIIVSTCLGSSLDVVLNLLLLFFVRITDLDSLTNLGLLRSVQGVQSGSLSSVFLGRGFDVVGVVVDVRVVHTIARASLRRAGSLAALSSYPSLTILPSWIVCRLRVRVRFILNLILGRNVSLILLLYQHLLLNLLFVQLLAWSEIEVINYVGDVSNTILLSVWILLDSSSFLLETVLDSFTLVIWGRFISFVSITISISWISFAKIAIICCLLLISQVDLILLRRGDILSS